MNHPPKKTPKDPLLPNDNQVDERNLIDLKDSAALSFEDRMNIYWKDNKGFLIGCIVVLFFVIAGYQGMRIVKEQTETSLQNEYAEADADNTLAEFANMYSDKALGGFAALKLADKAYSSGDFDKAVEFYSLAIVAIDEPIIAGRAKLGLAFALYSNGKNEEGLAQLNAITSDSSLSESIRTEAAYHLAIEAYMAGRADEFSSYAAHVNNSKFSGQWQQRLQSLPTIVVTESE